MLHSHLYVAVVLVVLQFGLPHPCAMPPRKVGRTLAVTNDDTACCIETALGSIIDSVYQDDLPLKALRRRYPYRCRKLYCGQADVLAARAESLACPICESAMKLRRIPKKKKETPSNCADLQ